MPVVARDLADPRPNPLNAKDPGAVMPEQRNAWKSA